VKLLDIGQARALRMADLPARAVARAGRSIMGNSDALAPSHGRNATGRSRTPSAVSDKKTAIANTVFAQRVYATASGRTIRGLPAWYSAHPMALMLSVVASVAVLPASQSRLAVGCLVARLVEL